MTERPIIFSGAMVRAILQGKKQQTRRIVNGVDECPHGYDAVTGWADGREARIKLAGGATLQCPHGARGDLLWVREAWRPTGVCAGKWTSVIYRADNAHLDAPYFFPNLARGGWRPSIHMPRVACRLRLDITAVRVERLQDISEDDAKAEGVEKNCDGLTAHPECPACKAAGKCQAEGEYLDYGEGEDGFPAPSAKESYRSLWDSLNAERAPWASNPWVWVIEFKRGTA